MGSLWSMVLLRRVTTGKIYHMSTSRFTSFQLISCHIPRLTDHKHQESFFRDIQHRYLTHCGSFPSVPALDEQFNLLSIKANNAYDTTKKSLSKSTEENEADVSILQNILMDMRKLREGLLASGRTDDFAKSTYLFIARASILMSHPESYLPSLRHLLYTLHKTNPLSKPEINELAGYLMLHLCCSTNSYHDAYEVKQRFGVRDHRVDTAIRALVTGDYWLFWTTKKAVDGYKSKIMDMAEKDMRKHTLKCIGSAYHTVDLAFLEGVTGRDWVVLTEEFSVAWEIEGGKVIIKRKPGGDSRQRMKPLETIKEPDVKKPEEENIQAKTIQPQAKTEKPAVTGLAASRWSTPRQDEKGKKESDSWTAWG